MKTKFEQLRALAEATSKKSMTDRGKDLPAVPPNVDLSKLPPSSREAYLRHLAAQMRPPPAPIKPSTNVKPSLKPGWGPVAPNLKGKPGDHFDTKPSAYGFVCGWGGAHPWPGQVIGMSVTGHNGMSRDHMIEWLLEAYRLWTNRAEVPGAVLAAAKNKMLPFKELTSQGVFGRALQAFGCEDVVKLFDEVADFFRTIERNPVAALELMKEMKGTFTTSGDIRWTVMEHLKSTLEEFERALRNGDVNCHIVDRKVIRIPGEYTFGEILDAANRRGWQRKDARGSLDFTMSNGARKVHVRKIIDRHGDRWEVTELA